MGAGVGGGAGARVTLAELQGDPHQLLARLREREPVSFVPVLGGWLVTRYDLALQVMRDAETFTVDDPRFSTSQVVGPSMLSLDGAGHARHRGAFADPFRPRAVRQRFAERLAAEAERLIGGFAAAGGAELRRSFAGPLAAATIAHALGLRRDEVGDLLQWYDAIVASVTDITAGRPLPRAGREAFGKLRARLIATTSSTLTPDELVSNAAVLLFGGIETTEGMIANATLALLERPARLAAAIAQPRALELAIEESLRLEPAAAMVDRYAAKDADLDGVTIRQGELVHVSITAANRDPAVFGDPDKFDPSRPDLRRHLAFAHGPHVCLGVHLARLEARVGLTALLGRLPELRLDPTRPAAVRGLVFRKPPELRAVWG